MLSHSDADLVRRDPVIPGLAMLLDSTALAGCLRRHVGRDDVEVGPTTYIKYQPGRNCLIGFELKVGTTCVPAHAAAYRFDARDKLDRARNGPGESGPLGPGRVAFDQEIIVLSVFPNDRKLTSLPVLADSKARQRLLSDLVPAYPELWQCSACTIVHKPQLRYVASVLSAPDSGILLKLYSARDYGVAATNARALSQYPHVGLARLRGTSDAHALLAFEWIPGQLLSEVLPALANQTQVLEEVGKVLAALHALEPVGLPILSRQAECKALADIAEAIGALCPHLAAKAMVLAGKLRSALAGLPPISRPIHGDFYARQLVITAQDVRILDLDSTVRSDPSQDLGNFIGYLEREALRGNLTPLRVAEMGQALIAGYQGGASGFRPSAAGLYSAVGLFRMGLKPFRNREPDWQERIEALMTRVEQLLAAAPRPIVVNERTRVG